MLMAATASVVSASPQLNKFWDHTTRGEDVQSSSQEKRGVDGELANYGLRVRKQDPNKLGIDRVRQYSGYLDNDVQDKHVFFWFFESRNKPSTDPVVLWLQGGPGAASTLGLFAEIGPAQFPGGKLASNPNSWNNNASLIVIDQPVNVGFSYSKYNVSSTEDASKDIYALLSLFFYTFPEYANQDFYITGESYEGHYAPVFANTILSHHNRNINLKGVMIGNGWIDPYTQFQYNQAMACGQGGIPAALNETECKYLGDHIPQCIDLIWKCYDTQKTEICFEANNYCESIIWTWFENTGHNRFDLFNHTSPPYVPSPYTEWLDSPDTKMVIGVDPNIPYRVVNPAVARDFNHTGDPARPTHLLLPGLLDQIPLLFYVGDYDFTCNWLGIQAAAKAIPWRGQAGFNNAPIKQLDAPTQKNYGTIQTYQGLSYIRIFKAGHSAPAYQPVALLDVLNRFIGGEWHK
ncbi:hypothetical protein NQ176_g5003 [Zarea fungicola]|uniref:Uncharacterized protein n=1 Tax=Zarea fungicola TaxID=93591 RepID=A0ACC1NAL8_9HYPO|nr:hypothetical protein NQ176_g5003 [Lecanicillium fungicola]